MGKIKGKNAHKFAQRAKQKDFTDMLNSHVLPALQLTGKEKVADFGTGSGNIIPFIIDKVNSFTAIEPSKEMTDIIKNNHGHYNNLHIVNKEADNTGLKENAFDIVITKFALHHIKNGAGVFNEAKRILKNNGRFVLIDMAFESHPLIKLNEPLWKIKKSMKQGWHELHCVYRNKKNIYQLAKETGLEITYEKKLPGKNSYRDRHYPAYIFIMEP